MEYGKNIPKYLVEKGNILKLIFWTAAFALVFINVYQPFNSRNWISDISDLSYFLYSSVLIIIGMSVVAISRVIMYKVVVKRHYPLSLGGYIAWIVAEVLGMSLFFCLVELLLLSDARNFAEIFRISLVNTSLVLLLPYSVLWLYFSWRDKARRLEELKTMQAKTADEQPVAEANPMIKFSDERGNIRWSIKQNDLLYIQGADNYITVYYRDNNKLAHFMVRNTLKQIEPEMRTRNIIRCHRSFCVNFARIKMLERVKDGVVIRLDFEPPIEIPVSKTYSQEVLNLFT